jgi:RNA polymerase sigma-70 factor (ECF subfamily)
MLHVDYVNYKTIKLRLSFRNTPLNIISGRRIALKFVQCKGKNIPSLSSYKNGIKQKYYKFMTKIQFQQKVLSLQDNMFHFALMLTTNRDDAKDLLQETTLKVLNNQNKFVENTNFKAWVMTIMRNIFINDYRKINASQTVIDKTENFYHLNLPQDSGLDTPEDSLSVQDIREAINNLNKEMNEPFSMLIAGYKYDEIAEKLDMPLGTVKNRIFLARKVLQENLKEMV